MALLTTGGLSNLVILMLLAELAEEFLSLWMVHHFAKGRPNRQSVTFHITYGVQRIFS